MATTAEQTGLVFVPVEPQQGLADIYRLYCQFQAYPMSPENFASCLKGRYFAYQLQNGKTLLGMYIGQQVLDDVSLIEIGVAPEYQRQGYGGMLLQHFEHQVAKRRGQQIWLEVRQSNQAAIALYHRHDYMDIDLRKNYYPSTHGMEDALIMCKYLA